MIEKIKETFGDCKNQAKCNCMIKTSYESYNRKIFYIYDNPDENEEPFKVVDENNSHQLIVQNNYEKDITVIKNDNCLSEEVNGVKKCDCMITDNEKLFFIEIKDTKLNGRGDARKKAIIQLEHSVNTFMEKEITTNFENSYAVICFKSLSDYPIKTSSNNLKELFRERYNTQLLEGNLINL